MTFLWPNMLFLLAIVPLLVWLYLRILGRRRRFGSGYGGLGLVDGASGPGARQHVPPAIFLASLAILIVAMARPQALVSLPRIQGTVILAFDVSGSMAATDLKPTRMEAAKTAARSFIENQPTSVQVGVVAFSDNGFSVQAPTNDKDTLLATINRLSPQRGTALGSGIQASLNTIAASLAPKVQGETAGEPSSLTNLTPEPTPSPTPYPPGKYSSAVMILLTDGENNENPDPLAAAQAAADRGVRIYAIGLGSPGGTTLKVNGFTVHTQLNEDLLKQLAENTGGAYYNAESAEELVKIYHSLNPQLLVSPEKTEVTALFAGASILALLVGGAFSLVWFNRLP